MYSKHKLTLCVMIAGVLVSYSPSTRADSKTIFVPRSLTSDSTLQLALTNYFIYHPRICSDIIPFCVAQVSYFHQQSTNWCNLARSFLPHSKSCAVIAENGQGDVGSLWLDLISPPGTSFRSRISLAPRRTVDGGYFNFFFDFSRWLSGAWVNIAFAAVRVEHHLHMCESDLAVNGTLESITDAGAALNNPVWRGGKFNSCKLHRSGVDDIQFKLGYNCFFRCDGHIGLYFVATAPTGYRSCANVIFEPLLGSKHGSVGVGFNSDIIVFNCGNHMVNWMADGNYRYVLAAHERRSFDLQGRGDWSRFMQVVTPEARSLSMPGINFFTQRVRVTPRSTIDLWTAYHYAYRTYNIEVGYNLWWRQREKVCLECTLPTLGIYDMVGDCQGDPVSAHNATISQSVIGPNKAPSDSVFTPLSQQALNRHSGSADRALTHTLYGALSYNSESWCLPVMIGIIGSYEFTHHRSALRQWLVMVKGGISF
jgi:hypothetical protein